MEKNELTKLYKYRGYTSRSLTMLSNNELYFATSDSFNDLFDCRARKEFEFKDNNEFIEKWSIFEKNRNKLSIDDAEEKLKSIAYDQDKKEAYIKHQSDEFQKIVLQSFGICSFSEINDDILMWSHYSDSHYGFCLEFERAPGNMLEQAQPIEYPPNHDFPFVDYWNDDPDELMEEVVKIILTKSNHWEYEKEWRIIHRPRTKIENYKGHLINYDKAMLTGVIFGHRMSNKERDTIKNILNTHTSKYYEANPVKNKFLIEVKEI